MADAENRLAAERQALNDPAQMGDDIPFTVVGATAARLWQPDLALLACTQQPVMLLSHDGTRKMQRVCSVRVPSGAGAAAADGPTSTINTNVHVWLGAHAMRTLGTYDQTSNDLTGIDYRSTATSSVGNIPGSPCRF